MTLAAYLSLLSWLLIPAPPRPKLVVVITVDQLRPTTSRAGKAS